MRTARFQKSAMPKDLLLPASMKKMLFVIGLLAIACNEPVVEKPEDLVPRETMVSLLYDLAILHAAKGVNPKLIKEKDMHTMEFLFNKYGIDSVRYMRSDLYYASVPEEYEAIYAAVVDRLDSTKQAIEEKRKRVNDSLKEAVRIKKTAVRPDSVTQTTGDELP